MTKPAALVPFSLKDAPSLIEVALPVQKLSAESFKEAQAVHGKALTALGSYWKGRKVLILNKAVILGCLLPATGNAAKDIEVFELLMGMDEATMRKRLTLKPTDAFPKRPYRELVYDAHRVDELEGDVHGHIWGTVNRHLGTHAVSIPDLVEQLGIMRFGHRPKFADTFSGSGQIPFEAARLGCDVYASDLNPIACMLTWGAFNIVGGTPDVRRDMEKRQQAMLERVEADIDALDVERDGKGWRAKVFLYCVEARCPETKWMVPLMPSRVVSKGAMAIAELVPDHAAKRYRIEIRSGVSAEELEAAKEGTVADYAMVHEVDGVTYRTPIPTLRGDFADDDGTPKNKLRPWGVHDVAPAKDDIFQERLYAIQWLREDSGRGRGGSYEFRSVTADDLKREAKVRAYVEGHIKDWQFQGWVPDMTIETGDETARLLRERGWTHWHHLFNPRQLLIAALVRRELTAHQACTFTQLLNWNSRLSPWHNGTGGGGMVCNVFYNQALNTLFNYGCRAMLYARGTLEPNLRTFPINHESKTIVENAAAADIESQSDLAVTDPPYGDAVKYEEILEFFIAWLRKNPPKEFAHWVWDSRRALAIKGEDDAFRQGMIAAYTRLTECMADNGLQVIMFTHQSGAIWADMANIVWASGLRVTAAWYVVTETDSALREGGHVKGTILLVLRKRTDSLRTTRDDLGWDLKDEVERQVETLTGLNQSTKASGRDENLFNDADLQMAGYAAALRSLTKYAIIDGKDMAAEAARPRVKGAKSLVEDLIDYAVALANEYLVPMGISKELWAELAGVERFYLKMIQQEAMGERKYDNFQNFAKAFQVKDFQVLMASKTKNKAAIMSAMDLGKKHMSSGSEIAGTPLRAVLYGMWQIQGEEDMEKVLLHLDHNLEQRFYEKAMRDRVTAIADYLAEKLKSLRPEEAEAARVLAEGIRNQR